MLILIFAGKTLTMIDTIYQPWPWFVAGPVIALVMLTLVWFGKSFGVSNNLRTLCAAGGGDSVADFFKFDWRNQVWNLVFAFGTIIGGFIAANFLSSGNGVVLATDTINELQKLGFANTTQGYLPSELFGTAALSSLKGLSLLIGGGFLVGFGARYAGGCTSGHAISGLSALQIPSLIAVVGFFIGGLTMVYLIMPLIFG